MPETAAWIDELRRVFGAEEIDGAIRAGLRGEPRFHAVEGDHEVGTPITFSAEFPALPSPSYQREAKP
jgi:hypothetical protein